MIPKLKDLVNGKNISKEDAQDLRDQQTQDAELKRKINDAINQFDEPITIIVHQKTGNWRWNNIYFWKMIQQKDENLWEYITEVLGERI